MLTFFEYLRQRAYDSILTGAQEALEFLDSEKNQTEPKSNASPLLNQTENRPAREQEKAETDLMPPPRRRGRPPKKDGGRK